MSETQFFTVKPVKVSQKFTIDAYLLPHVMYSGQKNVFIALLFAFILGKFQCHGHPI